MSGTSMDGIDVALLQTDGDKKIVELGHVSIAYTEETKTLLKSTEFAVKNFNGNLELAKQHYPECLIRYLIECLNMDSTRAGETLHQLSLYLYGEAASTESFQMDEIVRLSTCLHAAAVKKILAETGRRAEEIDVIGYHGQTLFHQPSQGITIQMGDGQLLAEQVGITVVNDFRNHDVASGGEGAPFAPIYHQDLARRDRKIPLAVVNCGGIANISIIRDTQAEHLIAFDTGPGNGLLDRLVKFRTGGTESMDKDGQYGKRGYVHEDLLVTLYEQAIIKNGQNYFLLSPPKSLDINDMVLIPASNALSLEDACATLAAFTAQTIVDGLDRVALSPAEIPQHWVLVGGGWHNPVIKRELEQRLKTKLGASAMIQTAAEVVGIVRR